MSERAFADGSQPSRLQVALAPWLGMFRPAAAAGALIAAPGRWFWPVYVGHVLLLAAIGVLLVMADATEVQTRPPPPGPAASLPANTFTIFPPPPEVTSRTLAEVWRDWHAEGSIGRAELLFVLFATITVVGTAFLAWLNLPRVHRTGPIGSAYQRAFRCVASGGGLLVLGTLGVGTCVVWTFHTERVDPSGPSTAAVVLALTGVPLAAILVLVRIGQAVSAVANEPVHLDLPKRCQQCGYDLAHQPPDAVCPECAYPVADSLDPRRRPGVAWERSKNREWLTNAATIVARPATFYAQLRLRTPPALAASFAKHIYVFIGFGAGLWAVLMAIVMRQDLPSAPLFALYAPLVCWYGHRLGGALVITWWIYRRALPDTRWAAKVLAYEAAFLWVFCVFWGLLVSSYALFGMWISEVFGTEFFYGVFDAPGEGVAVFGGTALLALSWLWRYQIALRAIRWSNH